MRQIALDTETTGLEVTEGHRIIQIGCVELIDRRLTGNSFDQRLQPDREIDAGATAVHGITNADLKDKPRFGDIAADFLEFIKDAQLIIHNAPFDLGFLNQELTRWQPGHPSIESQWDIIDTLDMARQRYPGQHNNLDALCSRLSVIRKERHAWRKNTSQRDAHDALEDAELLADVYLALTRDQGELLQDRKNDENQNFGHKATRTSIPQHIAAQLIVVRATEAERQADAAHPCRN